MVARERAGMAMGVGAAAVADSARGAARAASVHAMAVSGPTRSAGRREGIGGLLRRGGVDKTAASEARSLLGSAQVSTRVPVLIEILRVPSLASASPDVECPPRGWLTGRAHRGPTSRPETEA